MALDDVSFSQIAPPSPPPLPPDFPGGYFITGPCSLTDGGSCATSPNYPNGYGDNEECTISGVPPVELETVGFHVERCAFGCRCDYLTVNGTKYCGTAGPEGAVAEDGVIKWRSDGINVRSGWKARPWSLSLPFRLLSDALLPLPSDLLGDPAAFTAITAITAPVAAVAAVAAAAAAAAGLH